MNLEQRYSGTQSLLEDPWAKIKENAIIMQQNVRNGHLLIILRMFTKCNIENYTEVLGENILVKFFWLRKHLKFTSINAEINMDSIVISIIYCEVVFFSLKFLPKVTFCLRLPN